MSKTMEFKMTTPTPQNPNFTNKKTLKMVCSSCYLPKENPIRPMGEDAHFISIAGESAGVADGVGGCYDFGIDAGIYARELMANSALFSGAGNDPKASLSAAFAASKSNGTSTACLISHRSGVLRSANVGDSGYILFRHGIALGRSTTMQRSFNFPIQLGKYPVGARPECAEETAIMVEEGDIIVLATDGFLDNVFPEEAAAILRAAGGARLDRLAYHLVERAYFNSIGKVRDTPYSLAARIAGVPKYGGKIDDITVVVALIVAANAI